MRSLFYNKNTLYVRDPVFFALFLFYILSNPLLSMVYIQGSNLFRILLLMACVMMHFQAKKIAFMFVIQKELPFEDIWREFFNWHADRNQFRIYVHANPKFFFSRRSFFTNTQVPNRLSVQWGKLSLVAANQILVREALKDPENEFFALFSESCIPVQPFSVWKKLLDQEKSLIHACIVKGERTNSNRWNEEIGIPKEMWRKSENWFGLIRKHAEIFAEMNISKWQHVFAADEHIIPTTLAAMGLENETTCGYMTRVSWNLSVNHNHPLSLSENNITTELLQAIHSPAGLRFPCSGIPNVCHFAARKFDRTAAKPLFDQLGILFHNGLTNKSYDNHQYYRLFPHVRIDTRIKLHRFHYALNTDEQIRCLIPSKAVSGYVAMYSTHANWYAAGIPKVNWEVEGKWPLGTFVAESNSCERADAGQVWVKGTIFGN